MDFGKKGLQLRARARVQVLGDFEVIEKNFGIHLHSPSKMKIHHFHHLQHPIKDKPFPILVVSLSDFIARLAALVPKPRLHFTRFYGVFAPNSAH